MLKEHKKYKYMEKMMGEHLKKVLNEMCRRIDVSYNDINFWKKDWYLEHSWTQKQQDDFADWMFKYLKKNSAARREIMRFPSDNNAIIKKLVENLILNYGWTVK